VAHILDIDPRVLIQLYLEGEDDEHFVHDPGYLLYPSAPPRPYLRAYVVYDRYAELLRRFRESQVEVRQVD